MFEKYLLNVREQKPLIHNITNYVTVNDVANIILACGGSPIMSDEPLEVEDITSICKALNINIGTLNQNTVKSMILAGKKSNELKHPILLDPVGVGASKYRNDTIDTLLKEIHFTAIKGNISEIKSMALGSSTTTGVDANILDVVTDKNLDFSISLVKELSISTNAIIAVTGAIDLVTDGNTCYVIRNGIPFMEKITGTGCQLAGMMTAFLAANPDSPLEACASSVCVMGLAGEIAQKHLLPTEGNSTYRNRIIDAIYNMSSEQLKDGEKVEIR